MAEFHVSRYVLEEGRLPMLCMRCGAPASVTRAKMLQEIPLWWQFLGGFFVVGQEQCFGVIPFCARHKNHWPRTALLPWTPLLAAVGGLVFCAVDGETAFTGWLALAVAILAPVCCLLAVIAHKTSIHAKLVGDDGVVLGGVSAAFLERLQALPDPYGRLEEQGRFGRGP